MPVCMKWVHGRKEGLRSELEMRKVVGITGQGHKCEKVRKQQRDQWKELTLHSSKHSLVGKRVF